MVLSKFLFLCFYQYLELQKPLYERRNAIISGAAQATKEEIEAGSQASLKDDPLYTPLPSDEATPAAIPEFWLTALRNHVGLSEIITERDAGALKNLIDIRLSYLPSDSPKPGFKISFIFSPNDYFENDVLDKTYLYQEEVGYAGDFVYDRAIGTEIKWKEEKDLTKEFEIKKQRNKSTVICIYIEHISSFSLDTNRTRLVRKARPTDSFFNFFSPPVPPAEAEESEDIDEEELEELEEKLEMDYQIGEDLKEKVDTLAIIRSLLTNDKCSRSSRVPLIISLAKPLSMTLWMKTKMSLMSWMMKTRTASSMTRYDPLTYLDVTHCGSFLSRILIQKSSCQDVAALPKAAAARVPVPSTLKSANSSRRTSHLYASRHHLPKFSVVAFC
jgi:hypothetical protein